MAPEGSVRYWPGTSISVAHATNPFYVSYMSCVTFPILEPQVSAQEQTLLYWPFRRAPATLADTLHFPAERVPIDFNFQMLHRLHFMALVLWVGGTNLGSRHHTLQQVFCSQNILPAFQPPHLGVGASPLCHLLLPSLYVASSINYWMSFSLSFKLIAL